MATWTRKWDCGSTTSTPIFPTTSSRCGHHSASIVAPPTRCHYPLSTETELFCSYSNTMQHVHCCWCWIHQSQWKVHASEYLPKWTSRVATRILHEPNLLVRKSLASRRLWFHPVVLQRRWSSRRPSIEWVDSCQRNCSATNNHM